MELIQVLGRFVTAVVGIAKRKRLVVASTMTKREGEAADLIKADEG